MEENYSMSFLESPPKRKRFVFLLDNAGYHKTSPIMNYLNKFTRIKVEFFPPYSSELNPTETCWKIVKDNVTNSTSYPDLDNMQESIEGFLDNHFFILNVSNYLSQKWLKVIGDTDKIEIKIRFKKYLSSLDIQTSQ